jgi:hypothetical protein
VSKILPFEIVKPGRELENLSAFLTFSRKQRTGMRGVKELGRPNFYFEAAKFSGCLITEHVCQNARVSRAKRENFAHKAVPKFLLIVFHWDFCRKISWHQRC